MKAAVISMGSISSRWTIDALKKYFKQADHIDIKELEVSIGGKEGGVLYQGKPLPEYDCIYAKGSFRYANLLRAITTILGSKCYLPIEASAFTAGHDKLLTHLILQSAKIPMPKTYIASTAEAGKKILKKISYPVVMKLPAGTHGKGVMLADSYESASSMIDALALLKQPFLLQEYIETEGTDTRAIVVGNEVIAAMKRTAVQGEKRANIHAGGKGEGVKLDDKTQKAAVATARAMGCDICAVDILQGVKGPLVIEINLSPGLQGITNATGIPVAEKIAKFLHERTKEIKEKEVMRELLPPQEFISDVEYRGNRLLIPEIVTNITKLISGEEVVIKAEKGKFSVEKIK